MFDWLRKLIAKFRKPKYLEFPEGHGFDRYDVGGDGRLNRERFEELFLKPKQTKTVLIAQKNRERQRNTLGYGLKSRNFKPRPAYEKKLWKLDKKPSLEESD